MNKLRIAYITYEYPPDIGQGGIATYTRNAVQTMSLLGHDVEVFCGSHHRDLTEEYFGGTTHRILSKDSDEFRINVLKKFSEIHDKNPFDIVESPEINGNGYEIKKKYPYLPFTVKLHTPAVFQIRILNTYVSFKKKMRFFLGALKRGTWDLGYWSKHDKNQKNDIDYKIAEIADSISSPSVSLKAWAINFWHIKNEKITVLPYPYVPSEELLNIPFNTETNTVTLTGKLNVHKGLVALTEAIPKVLDKHPETTFRLIGNDGDSHIDGVSMKEHMLSKLSKYENNLEFISGIPLDEIPKYLGMTDICVYPSIWDNFPLVCMEAMSAGRTIVASNQGGMYDMLKETNAGILVNPKRPKQIANALIKVLNSKELRLQFATRARERVLKEYNFEKIGKKMENYYQEVIDLVKAKNK